jgi:hypothetical protein
VPERFKEVVDVAGDHPVDHEQEALAYLAWG